MIKTKILDAQLLLDFDADLDKREDFRIGITTPGLAVAEDQVGDLNNL